jgi:hypothetical protein
MLNPKALAHAAAVIAAIGYAVFFLAAMLLVVAPVGAVGMGMFSMLGAAGGMGLLMVIVQVAVVWVLAYLFGVLYNRFNK